MIKRRLGATLNAKTYWSQCRALMLKVITHNIMIICYVLWGFLQSTPDPFFQSAGSDDVRPASVNRWPVGWISTLASRRRPSNRIVHVAWIGSPTVWVLMTNSSPGVHRPRRAIRL